MAFVENKEWLSERGLEKNHQDRLGAGGIVGEPSRYSRLGEEWWYCRITIIIGWGKMEGTAGKPRRGWGSGPA